MVGCSCSMAAKKSTRVGLELALVVVVAAADEAPDVEAWAVDVSFAAGLGVGDAIKTVRFVEDKFER
jgi:hypothetical protein